MRVGRNESCPCGSGKKFKACCDGKQARMSRGLIGLMAAIGVIAAVGVVAAIRDQEPQTTTTPLRASAVSTTPRQQPPGPAPAGKVWSVEHGHWHDQSPKPAGAKGGSNSPVQVSTASVPIPRKPQPPGPVPAGKVWSPEHGHWHDVQK